MRPINRDLAALKPQIWAAVRQRFVLNWKGVHGPSHWGRVCAHARSLSAELSVDPTVPTLFAWLHDSCRVDEAMDPGHGPRAARFAEELHGRGLLPLSHRELDSLQHAIADHSRGFIEGPLVVQICWDADRLDLARVGFRPRPDRLCTDAARRRIEQAQQWSLGGPRPRPVSPDPDDPLEEEAPRPWRPR